MTFVIPMMFFACLQWEPPENTVNGFKFEQPVTIVADHRQILIDHGEWQLAYGCYAVHATDNSAVSAIGNMTFSGSTDRSIFRVDKK